jgi:IPT/TIG domain
MAKLIVDSQGILCGRSFGYVAYCLLLSLVACGGGGGGTGGPPRSLSLSVGPSPLYLYPSGSFTLKVNATTTGSSAVPTVAAIQLPSGVSTTTTFPLAVPSGGASIDLQTGPTLVAGTYSLTLQATAGPVVASANVSLMIQNAPPIFFFTGAPYFDVGVPFGGSGQFQVSVVGNPPAIYNIKLSLSGLPPGTTATINPPTITPGQSTTVTITASSTAPVTQNFNVTLTGTAASPVAPASTSFLVDVTAPPGTAPNNRTDYVSTEDTPYGAVYDRAHGLLFASNPSWNRVDVISSTTHALVAHIPVRDPHGIDITQDEKTVWVVGQSMQTVSIDTTTLIPATHALPPSPFGYWAGGQLCVLSDGRLMIVAGLGGGATIPSLVIWTPSTNAISFPSPVGGVGGDGMYRSGDGTRVYFLASDSGGAAYYYDVLSRTFSKVFHLGGYADDAAVNGDGSRIFVCDANGPNVYDGSFNLIGSVPGCGAGSLFQGGSVFSADNRYLYQECLFSVPLILKIDASTLNVVSSAPAMPMVPVLTQLSQGFYVPVPFGVDGSGMIFGLEVSGISFDDGAFTQTYSPQVSSPIFMQHMSPYFGSLTGGTVSSGFGDAFGTTPDVWYGSNRGTAVNAMGDILITSPPASTPGPVNIKMLFPDGVEVFDPLFFSYGPFLQYALLSGSPPQGNVAGQVMGYGLPGDGTSGTLTIGGASASLTPPGATGLLFAGTPFPNKVLNYTTPAGVQGWTDITLTTKEGSFTLPKALYYAQSVTDYASPDTFNAILLDRSRQQLYLSAGDHIDVFSLASHQFLAPFTPPAQGSTKQFAGLALTPDGTQLLATDLLDGSLAIIDPDNPATSAVIPIAAVGTNGNPGCYVGPLYVAATSTQKAFVVTGGMPKPSCGPGGMVYVVDLSTRTVGPPPASSTCTIFAIVPGHVAATQSGNQVAIGGSGYPGFCIYDAATNTYTSNGASQTYGAAISGDGNAGAADYVLTDSAANAVGQVAKPAVFYNYPDFNGAQDLQNPQLNDSGSLYYMAYSNFFDIIDVQQGSLRMRFSLSETVSPSAGPLAIDSGGRFVYLITNQGLTIVDLGAAPLSFGWANPTSVPVGGHVTIRGSGFNSSTSASVGGKAAVVTHLDENTLSLILPSISTGATSIQFTNGDGSTYTAAGVLTVQ